MMMLGEKMGVSVGAKEAVTEEATGAVEVGLRSGEQNPDVP